MSTESEDSQLESDDTEENDIVSELTEEEKKTVEKFSRQFSINSVVSIRSRESELDVDEHNDGPCGEDEEGFTQEEALQLQRVIQAFQNYKDTKAGNQDSTDGKKYKRLSSNQSYEFLDQGSNTRFVSPGRFHVVISEDTKDLVKEVNLMIQRRKKSRKRRFSKEVLVVDNQEVLSANPNAVTNFERLQTRAQLHAGQVKIEINDYGKHLTAGNSSFPNENGALSAPIGQTNLGFSLLSQPPAKQKFKWAVRAVILSNREKRREEKIKKRNDFFEKFWKRRGDVGWLELLFCLVGPIAFIADSITDLKVASDHIATGHPWWGTFTLMLVIFPTILVNVVSYLFYKDDEEHTDRKPESGWKMVKIAHSLQVGLIERYWRIFRKGYKIKFTKPKLQEVEPYQLYIAMNLDAAMLQMILAFTEDAPQLVLQLYVLIRRKLVEKLISTSLQDMWTLASICFSFISYSRALVNYMKCLRNSKKYKGQLRWYGYLAMWFWRAFMFTSRILVLVFFATEFHLWFFLVLALHFFIVLAIIWSHQVNFFAQQKWMQIFIRVVVAYIHTFCFFVLDAHKTIQWAVQYYVLVGVEAVIFSTLWFTNSTRYVSLKFELSGMAIIFLSYAMGLLMMIVYYKFLHPKFKRPQTKWYTKTNSPPKEELCEDVQNEDEEEGDDVESVKNAELNIHYPSRRPSTTVKQVELWL